MVDRDKAVNGTLGSKADSLGLPAAALRSPASLPAEGRGYILLLLAMANTLNYLDRSIVAVLIDPIKRELHLSDTALGFISGLGFALLYTVLGLPLARMADRIGRRVVIASGVLLWSLTTAAGGLASSGIQLVMARTGVGVGEAAGSAPSYALLSDLYDKAERPRALSIYSLGLPGGVFLGLLLGGWCNQVFGWRVALFCAGAPGLLVAALLFFTTCEPVRGDADAREADVGLYTTLQTLQFLFTQPSYVLALLGSFCCGFGLNALFVWGPAFFGRVHHMSSAQIGTWVGTLLGLGGLAGVYTGGAVASRFGGDDDRWKLGVPAVCCLLACPVTILMLSTSSTPVALACVGLGSFLSYGLLGPLYSAYQAVAKVRMRALATAIHQLLGSLGGLGLGALIVGMLDDRLAAKYGQAAIAHSLLVPMSLFAPAAVFYAAAAWRIRADVRRASENARRV